MPCPAVLFLPGALGTAISTHHHFGLLSSDGDVGATMNRIISHRTVRMRRTRSWFLHHLPPARTSLFLLVLPLFGSIGGR